MQTNKFTSYETKLEQNVYGSLKGSIRTTLLLKDLTDTYPAFSASPLKIIDIGGGGGHFGRMCCRLGHSVTLLENNPKMLALAKTAWQNEKCSGDMIFVEEDFLSAGCITQQPYDVVLMHGSAEWMADPEKAINKAADFVKSGGVFSLLIYNSNRNILKQGINGRLLRSTLASKKKKLTPPGARAPEEIFNLLHKLGGTIHMFSGIRIFYSFFRQNDTSVLTPKEWLQQEIIYYRKEPFSRFGEHTHCIWSPDCVI